MSSTLGVREALAVSRSAGCCSLGGATKLEVAERAAAAIAVAVNVFGNCVNGNEMVDDADAGVMGDDAVADVVDVLIDEAVV